MHDLLAFMPRPRMKHTPPADIRHTVNDLVDDIQVLAAANQLIVLTVLAQYAHEERARVKDDKTDAAQIEGDSSA